MTRKGKKRSNKDLNVANHVVCVIDVLGQRERLKSWPQLTNNVELTAKQKEGIDQTIGPICQLQQDFQRFFQYSRPLSPAMAAASTEQQKDKYDTPAN